MTKQDSYKAISDLISKEFGDAVGNILKGIQDIANGIPTNAIKLPDDLVNQKDAKTICKDFIEELVGVNIDMGFASKTQKVKEDNHVVPKILLPSGQEGDDKVKISILAPSRSVKVNTSY